MRSTSLISALSGIAVGAVACSGESSSRDATATPSVIRYEAHVSAGGVNPPAGEIKNPKSDGKDAVASGATLFSSMNCDGCHGGAGSGWAAPSLVDGRWRYGGAEEEIFTSIFYGRPKGMPAFGGVLGTEGVWMIVAYLKSLQVPPVVPTVSWLPGGSATAQPAVATTEPAAPAEPEKKAAPEEMPAKYGCTACHATDRKVVGPAFKEVAAKYRGQDVGEKLAAKIRNGGSGVWGEVPMPPNPQVPDDDLQAVVKWILALK